MTSRCPHLGGNPPVLLALDLADAADQRTIRRMLTHDATRPGAHHELTNLLRLSGALDQARQMAHHREASARDALAGLPPGPHIQALHELTRQQPSSQ